MAARLASIAVAAITLAACSMPLCAAGSLPWVTSCQEWPGVPTAKQAPQAWTVGVSQETSPTSVEPPSPSSRTSNASTSAAEDSGGTSPVNDSRIFSAKLRSSSVYSTPPTRSRFRCITRPRISLGRSA